MGYGFNNRVWCDTSTTGTGNVTIGSAKPAHCTPAQSGTVDGDTRTWLLEEGNDFEIFRGAYTSSGTVVTRGTVILSKIGGTAGTSRMNLAGTATIREVAAAEDLLLISDQIQALNTLGLVDLSKVPVVGGVRATEVADFANGFYWFNERQYPSLMTWLNACNSIFQRASKAMKRDANGRLFEVYNDVPRFEHNSSGTSLGILIESISTNRLNYTEDFSNAVWTKTGSSIAGVTIIDPRGASYPSPGAYLKITENSATSLHSVYQASNNIADAPHAGSIFAKAGTRTRGRISIVASNNGAAASFDLSAGTISSPVVLGTGTALKSIIVPYPYGWYRVGVVGKIGAGATNAYIQFDMADASGNVTYAGNGSSYMYIFGAQSEALAIPSSYYPIPYAVGYNRQPDFLYRYSDVQPAAITKVIKARTPKVAPPAYALLIHMDDGTEANDFEVYQTDTGHIMLQLRSGWVEQGTIDLGYIAPDTDFKIAYRGSAAGFAASINGGATVTQSLTTWPLTMVVERYGVNATETFDRYWNSTIAYQATIPVAASDSELQALSA